MPIDPPEGNPGAIPDDSTDFAPATRYIPTGKKTCQGLAYKLKSLNMIMAKMNKVKISKKTEGELLVGLLESIVHEAESDLNEPALRQKYWQLSVEAVLRMQELHAKVSAECYDLETKRSDTRLKRTMWKDKNGIGKTVNAQVEDSMAEVAALMRGK